MTTMTVQSPALMTTGVELRKAVRWVQPGVHRGAEVLGAVRVTVAAGRLIFSSFDCETIRMADLTLGDDTGPVASVLVDGAALANLAAAAADGRKPVEVAITGSTQVDVTSEPGTDRAGRLTLAACDPAGYPAIPALPGLAAILDPALFRAAVTRVGGLVSKERELPWLQSVRIQARTDAVTFGATDRYRMGVEHVPATVMADADVLFPGRLADAFTRVTDGPQVYLLADGLGLAGLTDGTWTVITRMVQAEPINLEKYLASQPEPEVTLTVGAAILAALLNSAAAVQPAKKGELAWVDITAVPGKGLDMTLHHGATAWTGKLDAVTHDGPELVAAYKPAMLASMLAVLDGDVVIHLTPGPDGRVLKGAVITAGSAPGFTGAVGGVDPSKAPK